MRTPPKTKGEGVRERAAGVGVEGSGHEGGADEAAAGWERE
jgi:hypothetical protein